MNIRFLDVFMKDKQKYPKLAPIDYKILAPVERQEKGPFTEYVGSGIALEKHPQYCLFEDYGVRNPVCRVCESPAVLCIFFVHYVCNAGHGIQYELECQDCAHYMVCDVDEG